MHNLQLLLIALLSFLTTLTAANKDSRPEHIQKLSKRGCDFACKRQADCDNICYTQPFSDIMLGVCRNGKCYCGFMPSDRVH
ncbi:uncharacterized protein EV154DRAFT_524689 [Mucor mucedo]|uniref:uncharacterized protein n=1 Tax=Mucor mucedo TaxID=29922 RepID=UPI0022207325|nr:uncharacterized protein EV154DRAFT_524689 [Mucor mucedo]KAI7879210.1 hypothetical protein EV154DRAFT_524689 [Mucor mucedo]